jgi:hypothetical protein
MRKLQHKGQTYKQIHDQAMAFLSPEIDLASLVLVRESLFTLLMSLFPRIQDAPVGENIVTFERGFVETNQVLAVQLLDHWKDDLEAILGDEGWEMLKSPVEQLSGLLREGLPVVGDKVHLLYSFSEAERVLVDLRNSHQILDHAIKCRDPGDRSPSQLMQMRMISGGASHE